MEGTWADGDAVPWGMTLGPDGALYVAVDRSYPAPNGREGVYTMVHFSGAPPQFCCVG